MTMGERKLVIPALGPLYNSLDGYMDLLLRITVGGFLIPHGMQKLFGLWGGNIEGAAGFMSKMGLEPGLFWAYYIGGLEFFGGILLVIGLFTRPVALLVVGFMLVAAFKVHIAIGGFFWTNTGYEYPLMWGIAAFIVMIRGGGKYSFDAKMGKEI